MSTLTKYFVASAMAAPALSLAHDGHGMPSAMHFHASDIWGFSMLAVVAVAVFWLAKKK